VAIPAFYVSEGDKTSIQDIVDQLEGEEFDHEHDRITRLVYIQISKLDGTVGTVLRAPIKSRETCACGLPAADREMFFTIFWIITAINGVSDPADLAQLGESSHTNASLAALKAYGLYERLKPARRSPSGDVR